MTLYVKTGPRSYRPATEKELLSEAAKIYVGRRKKHGGAGGFAAMTPERRREILAKRWGKGRSDSPDEK